MPRTRKAKASEIIIPPTPQWTTACPDWEQRIRSGRGLIPFDPLFPEEAKAGLDTFNALRVVDVAGSPLMGSIARPWLLEFVASVFGAYDAVTGKRLIREWLLLISKKNTKSTSAGLLMLAILILNWREAGEFGILAPTVEVANNAFKPARDAIKADEELSDLMHVQDNTRTIKHRGTNATMQVVASDSEAVAGKKWIITLVDELWLFGKRANAENMFREATGGMASRDEGAIIWLSTQADEPPAGVFKQKIDYARGVRDGKIHDPEFCPILYEFPESMLKNEEHLNPKNFYMTNPNLGASVSEAFLLREFKKAENDGETSMQGFLAKHLNIEVGLNKASDRWAGADFWLPQTDESLRSLDELLRRSDHVVIGADGGGLDDLFGLAVLGNETRTGRWLHWGRAWAHPIVLERRKSIAPALHDFEKDGDLVFVNEVGDDVRQVCDIIETIYYRGILGAIGVDPAGISSLLMELADRKLDTMMDDNGREVARIKGISQNYTLAVAIKNAERRLAAKTLLHGGTRLMSWCVGNAKTVSSKSAVYIDKAVSGKAKIDPLMAMFNAVQLLSLNPQGAKSFWEKHEADSNATA